jgi:alkyl sulfatase BDS1-like metallo-beta-lactamase superfamily hydrolase
MNTLPLRLIAVALLLCACSRETPPIPGNDSAVDAAGNTPASEFTARANAAVAASLPTDTTDIADAERGLIEREQGLVIESTVTGRRWSADAFSFLQGEAPASVNPSLWRQANLNGMHGLYKVAEGIYQVRGYDVSNMTWIRGKTGWIVVDPLTSIETAAAATRLARKHLGNDPVKAVIFTAAWAGCWATRTPTACA